jgi:hypothetical protein
MYDASVKSLALIRGLQLKVDSSGAVQVRLAPEQAQADAGARATAARANGQAHGNGAPDPMCGGKRSAGGVGRINGHNRLTPFLEPAGAGIEE